MGTCCCLCNIVFYLVLGIVILPFWLIFRIFIFVRIDEEQIRMKDFSTDIIVPYTDIINISVQGKSTITDVGREPTPHSVHLIFTTKSQNSVTMDLKRYGFERGVKIAVFLLDRIKATQIIPESQIDNQLLVTGSVDYIVDESSEPVEPHEKNE
jgi:hypothetical protein